jgi:UDP-N-acetylmuramyl pentapeptide phosphotransferase/UDP-N-acetylglucosamine-1-phosphate transferase
VKTILISAVFALMTSILCTPLVVVYFRRRGFGQEIRIDGPQTHLVKRGTPTMGGVAIIGSTVVGYAFAHVIIAIRGGGGPDASGLLALFLMVGLGGVGFLDDFIKIRRQRNLGLRARTKFLGQLFVSVAFAMMALQFPNKFGLTPASKNLSYVRDIGAIGLGAVGFVILAYLIVAATSNAVNLTDGLDGLAAGAAAMVFGAFTLIAFLQFRNPCQPTFHQGCYQVRDSLDHGRHRLARAGRADGRPGDPHPHRAAAGRARRAVRRDHGFVDLADGLVQVHAHPDRDRPADLPDGAAASPLRARRLGAGHDHRPVLDHVRNGCRVRDGAVLRGLHREWLICSTTCVAARCSYAVHGSPGRRRRVRCSATPPGSC